MKKATVKALSLAQAFLLFCTVAFAATPVYAAGWDGKSAGKFGGGTGTQSDPYIISEPGHLKYLAEKVNASSSVSYEDKYFILTADLDLNNQEWTPIGKSDDRYFAGCFDGNGHTIKNLKIDEGTFESMDHQGLFGVVRGNKRNKSPLLIKNLNVSGSITSTSNNNNAGGIAGAIMGASISDCTADIKISVDKGMVAGGIVGRITYYSDNDITVIENCHATANITVNGESGTERSKAGGIVGYSEGRDITVKSCSASVNITSKKHGAYLGGLAGYVQYGSFICCYVTGTIKGQNDTFGGGFIGKGGKFGDKSSTGEHFRIEDCFSTVDVSASEWSYLGGFVGQKNDSNSTVMRNSYWTGSISGDGLTTTGTVVGEDLNENSISACLYTVSNYRYSDDKYDLKAVDLTRTPSGYFADMLTANSEVGSWTPDADLNLPVPQYAVLTQSYNVTVTDPAEGEVVGALLTEDYTLEDFKKYHLDDLPQLITAGATKIKKDETLVLGLHVSTKNYDYIFDSAKLWIVNDTVTAAKEGFLIIENLDKNITVKPVTKSEMEKDTVKYAVINFINKYIAEISPEIEAWINENMVSENEITRAMLAVIICRFINEQGLTLETAIETMKNAELMQGDGNGEIVPDEVMTKEQIVTVLYRVANYLGLTLDEAAKPAEIQDLGAVSSWAREAVEDFIAKGLITGNTDGYFNPSAHVTLGELYQIYLNILNKDDNAFEDVPEVVNVEEEIGELVELPVQDEQTEQSEPVEQTEQTELTTPEQTETIGREQSGEQTESSEQSGSNEPAQSSEQSGSNEPAQSGEQTESNE